MVYVTTNIKEFSLGNGLMGPVTIEADLRRTGLGTRTTRRSGDLNRQHELSILWPKLSSERTRQRPIYLPRAPQRLLVSYIN